MVLFALFVPLTLVNFVQVATLLLLSQQEERYILERNGNVALQNKIEDLQRNLLQVILKLFSAYTFTPIIFS